MHVRVTISGMVQGVGFRPFLHRLAELYAITGWARNTTDGVELELTGSRTEAFLEAVRRDPPLLARIREITREDLPEREPFSDFQILPSRISPRAGVLLTPDITPCPACLREMNDPKDRRYGYPFLNCTDCGPRFSIVESLPYDRERTTMADFPMCPACAAEYTDIRSRRYHAQPTCCPVCGPKAYFLDEAGRLLTDDTARALDLSRQLLREGKILTVKGLGGMHLACDALEEAAVLRLRQRKRRPDKPLAVMCRNLTAAAALCEITPREQEVLLSAARPIVLLRLRKSLPWLSSTRELGVMLPYTPLHELLFRDAPEILVMTSANPSDRPVFLDDREALAALSGIADGFLLNNRPIAERCDDSLVRIADGEISFLRRSRGYVPAPVDVKGLQPDILACGAEQKASFTLAGPGQAFLSQHIGDLKSAEVLEHYTHSVSHFEALFGIRPRMLVCDLHPDYLSTDYALQRSGADRLPLLQVQHHWAHMASCMADNSLEEPCLGIIWDGTGLGTDGTIWGCEWLVGDLTGFERVGSIRPIPLPGGDRAASEIGRTAAGLRFLAERPAEEDAPWLPLLQRDLNCPRSSGLGRLFDGVYSIITGRKVSGYEGHAAQLLEAMAAGSDACWPVEINGGIFDTAAMIRHLLDDQAAGLPAEELARRFHNTLIELAVLQTRRILRERGSMPVVLSGGCFQNMILLSGILFRLRQEGIRVYHHRRVSCTDEGLSLGQAAIAGRSSLYVSGTAPADHPA